MRKLKNGDVVLVGERAEGVERSFIGRHAAIVNVYVTVGFDVIGGSKGPVRARLLPLDDSAYPYLLLNPHEIGAIVDPHVAKLLYGEIEP